MKKTTDDINTDIEAKVTDLETKVEEINNKYLRSLADYQNLEKQTQIWRDEFVKFANQGLISKLLDILDDLEKAQEHLKDDGLQLIVDKLTSVLKTNGLEEIEVMGKDFDPVSAEAVEVVPGDEDHKIVGIRAKGYKLNGKIIRPAKVVVSAIPSEAEGSH